MSIRNLHTSHNAPYLPPRILHTLCFHSSSGITAVPREIENSVYANCLFFLGGGRGGAIRCIMGDVQVASEEPYKKIFINRFLTPEEPVGNYI